MGATWRGDRLPPLSEAVRPAEAAAAAAAAVAAVAADQKGDGGVWGGEIGGDRGRGGEGGCNRISFIFSQRFWEESEKGGRGSLALARERKPAV